MELINGDTVKADTRVSVDITDDVRTLYNFAKPDFPTAKPQKAANGKFRRIKTVDGTFRRILGIVVSELDKSGPSYESQEGLEHTFQAVFLQDTDIQASIGDEMKEISLQLRLYRFCAVYCISNMDEWVRENLNTPKNAHATLPFTVALPSDGRYIVERDEGEPGYTVYFVPDDPKIMERYMVVIIDEKPQFSRYDTDSNVNNAGFAHDRVIMGSPFWEFIARRTILAQAEENERLVDAHRSNYVDYVMPLPPKDINMSEMTEQQIISRGALAVNNNIDPYMQANAPGQAPTQDITLDEFLRNVYAAGLKDGTNVAAISDEPQQDPDNYARSSRIKRLRPGDSVNRNPHAQLVLNSADLTKKYEIDLCTELKVPYSRYHMSEKGAYRKDDNIAEAEMFTSAIIAMQKQISKIFYILYQHTFGVIDDQILSAFQQWERKIALNASDVEILAAIGDRKSNDQDADDGALQDNRATSLINELSQLTPFDIAIFSYMNKIEIPDEAHRHMVTIQFMPISDSTTSDLSDYLNIYNAGILQEEMIDVIRSRMHLPEPVEGEEANVDARPSPAKRRKIAKDGDAEKD